ncbi:hypothetical protein [uncultured Clostridium sp.]|uniref:hypothetical protein n=1 Tax=uncultured Clostridium sp. TaxID=59620 RepID=UPI0026F39CCD|nr:hypothetical protein [uncultured Clostridium sp.]
MTKIHGSIIFKRGRYVTFNEDCDYVKSQLKLQKDSSHYVSFDPSTTSLGMCITDKNFNYHVLAEFKRISNDKDAFYRDVMYFLKVVFTDIKVDLVVYEQPPREKQYTRAGAILREFLGVMRSWRLTIPAFEWAHWDNILPHQWRSNIVNKSKGTYTPDGERRFTSKIENAKDIVDREPLLQQYFEEHVRSSDYDGFDAYGILHGYLEERFDKNGREKIIGNLKHKQEILVACRNYTVQEMKNPQLFWKDIDFLKVFKYKMVTLNPRYSLMDNIRVSVDKNEIAIIGIEDPLYRAQLMWEFDIPDRPNSFYFIFAFRNKDFDGRKLLGKRQEDTIKRVMKCSYV